MKKFLYGAGILMTCLISVMPLISSINTSNFFSNYKKNTEEISNGKTMSKVSEELTNIFEGENLKLKCNEYNSNSLSDEVLKMVHMDFESDRLFIDENELKISNFENNLINILLSVDFIKELNNSYNKGLFVYDISKNNVFYNDETKLDTKQLEYIGLSDSEIKEINETNYIKEKNQVWC